MAHPNINERRAWLKERLDQSQNLTRALSKEAANQFGCSVTAIYTDWSVLTQQANKPKRWMKPDNVSMTIRVRRIVRARDNNVCQYCAGDASRSAVLEHVVPALWGGVAEPKNIVIACHRCNVRKGRSVWIPRNFLEITENDPEWRELVLRLKKKEKEFNGHRKAGQTPRPQEAFDFSGTV